MATARLVIVLLILGVVVLLAVQNTAPALPLVFLGGQTVTLPLSVWLVMAIALGAFTTLVLTALLGSSGSRGGRSKAYKYRPQPFYEPVNPDDAAREAAEDMDSSQSNRSGSRPSPHRRPRDNRGFDHAAGGEGWQDWNNLQSSRQWNDWDAMEQAAQARGTSSSFSKSNVSTAGGIGSWLFGRRQARQEEQVNQSWRELSDDWDDLEHQNYRARGVSPVDESLDDINQGWDNGQGYRQPSRDFEVTQTPKRVYQDGSLYSYSYRNQDSSGQRDNVYAPADDVVYGDEGFDPNAYIDLSEPEDYGDVDEAANPANYGSEDYAEEDLGEPEVAEDGVVDADYRVIIPPSPAADGSAVAPETPPAQSSWDQSDDNDDDWNEAEDALTP